MNQEETFKKILAIRDKLKQESDFKENPIDVTLKPIMPFQTGNEISLIIIGQDPTIKNEISRRKIKNTLNLDKNGALKNYLIKICNGLGITLENVYATNVFKYFYTNPPAQTLHVLQTHLKLNLELLNEELVAFPDAKIITLGEPVLQLLAGKDKRVRNFWDYNTKTKSSNGTYTFCKAAENRLGKIFYPFPHQPSLRKKFYLSHLEEYIKFAENQG